MSVKINVIGGSSKSPSEPVRGKKNWQSWKAATRNLLEAMRYE